MTSNNPTAGQIMSGLAIIGVVVVVLFMNLFSSDRAVVSRCINVMLDASRAEGFYGEFLDMKREVDAAQEIIITSRRDMPLGGSTITTLEFTIDGRPSGMMCSM